MIKLPNLGNFFILLSKKKKKSTYIDIILKIGAL